MDYSNIDFSRNCFVNLHVEIYGVISGILFSNKDTLLFMERFFKSSHDWQPSFQYKKQFYTMGFVDPGNIEFVQFMLNEGIKQKNLEEEFFKQHGYYEQTCDFFEIWEDNDIDDVQISFPNKLECMSCV